MTLVSRSSLCTAAVVLKKGPKSGLVNAKDACSRLWLGSMFSTTSAASCSRRVSSAFLHGIFPLFTTN